MPSIPEFNAPALDIRPSEIGVESTAAAGRRLGVYGSQIAESDVSTGRAIAGGVKSVGDVAEQYAAHQNIISLARHGADVMAAGSQSLNAYFRGDDIPDDPNNPDAKKAALDERLNNPAAAKNWLDNTLNPMLDSYQQGAWTEGGQAYATHFTENLRTHLTTAALADQSTGAGLAAKDSLQKMADTTNTAMFKVNDLHSVQGFFNQFDGALTAIGKSSPTINANDFARLKEWGEEQKAKGLTTAIQGRISNGQSYDDLVKNYPQYVKPGENLQFERQEKFYRKGEENAIKQQLLLDHALAEDKASKYMNDAYKNFTVEDPATGKRIYTPEYTRAIGQVPIKFADAPRALLEAQHQQDLVTREQKPETDARISHGTYTGLLRDMRSIDTSDPGKEKELMDKAWEARLRDPGKADSMTEQDFTSFRNELAARKTPEGEALAKDRDLFFKRFGLQFDPGMGTDPKTAGNSYLAEMAARQREAEVQRKGDDPRSVYNPNSPNFFGTAANIQKYKIPLQDQLRALPSGQPLQNMTSPNIITSKTQYDALPSGANFVDDKGRKFIKP